MAAALQTSHPTPFYSMQKENRTRQNFIFLLVELYSPYFLLARSCGHHWTAREFGKVNIWQKGVTGV